MKAVIPCAKKEDSLFPLIESKPTGLMPVMGQPLVKHLVRKLKSSGIDDIYLVTNYREEMFREEFGEFTDVNIVTQEEIEGTGSAVEECNFIEDDFLVVNGDVATSENNLKSLIEKHESSDSEVTVLSKESSSPRKFGVLSITNDKIDSIKEKPENPENTLVNTGIYAFKPSVFEYLDDMGSEKDLTEAVEMIIEKGEARFELAEDYWIDIGSPRKLWEADRVMRNKEISETKIDGNAEVHENVEILGEAVVEEGAEIKPGTVVEGSCYIGESAILGPNAVVSDSTVSKGCQLRSCNVESSLLFEENIVDSSTVVEQSVIGEESDIKSNTSIRESFIGPRSFIEVNNSIYGVKFVPDARTDLSEISK
ncbi:MAG: NTP transferase domain-containing protein [Nanohaloarchaea archaeon]|nr:NTP transferase domain-containing protein [Candidatus Nanohaloarchaea archaeon]